MNITIKKFGDWKRLLKVLSNAPDRVKHAIKGATLLNAVELVSYMKKSIDEQNLDNPVLHWFTIQQKGSSKALIDNADLRNSITYQIITY